MLVISLMENMLKTIEQFIQTNNIQIKENQGGKKLEMDEGLMVRMENLNRTINRIADQEEIIESFQGIQSQSENKYMQFMKNTFLKFDQKLEIAIKLKEQEVEELRKRNS